MKTSNANISTLQQQHQQLSPPPQKQLQQIEQQQQLLILRNKLHQNQQQQQHYSHHHNGKQLRAISEEKQQEEQQHEKEEENKNIDDDIIYESLPEALQQRMQFEDMNYDNDKNDNTERPNRSLMDMDIISVDGNFDMPSSSSSSAQSFKVDHDMDQPIKVLTLGADSQERTEDKDEGSANFDNNNDDNDDDDDDDDENDDANNDDENGFFASQDKNSNNGAIKIISTPLDKVGIFYDDHESSSKKTETTHSFTDFDALSPDPRSNHNSNSKITSVLTPDGKVALLYHEDDETNSKEEPIFNTTKRISVGGANDVDNNNHKSSHKKDMNDDGTAPITDDDDYDYEDDDEEDNDEDNINDNMSNNLNDAAPVRQNDGQDQQTAADHVSESDTITPTPGSSSSLVRPTDSVLPIINRPLSEVLGIKKNQFKQFRIKDSATTTTTPRPTTARSMSSSSTPWPQPAHALATGLEPDIPLHAPNANLNFNFGAVPGLQDVDFSRDNIMLSERNKAMDAANNAAVEQKVEEIVEKKIQDEVINLAILPILEEELERLQQQNRRYYRPRPKHTEEELSDIHCVMQIIMGIAAVTTVFGMLGTFFKQRILDQLRMLH